MKAGIRKASNALAQHLRRVVPVAFSELRDSIDPHATGVKINAPHAAAIEVGSRPHFPPIEPLIAWVKLRGMQGLVDERSSGRIPGGSAAPSAVAGMIGSMEKGGAVSVDAPRRIAFLIARSISKRGTKPHFYARDSIPTAERLLHQQMQKAVPDR